MSQEPYQNIEPSRISQTSFEVVIWIFYGLAIVMAFIRTSFRVYTFRKIDADDCFLILAVLTLTGTVATIQILYPTFLLQNQVAIGQVEAGPEFGSHMSSIVKIQGAAVRLSWLTIYFVKYAYLMFFRNLLQRVRKMMVWWWIVFAGITSCGIVGFAFHWTICNHDGPDILEYCPIPLITARGQTWLIVTTATDAVSDVLLITVPVMILWNVQIPLRAKFGIGAALGLSLFMIIIAIVRISLGYLVPGVTDNVWIYFCWNLESSTAVFMVSATAFRSTFGHHQNTKANRPKTSGHIPLRTLPSRGTGERSPTTPKLLRDDQNVSRIKTTYKFEVKEIDDRKGGMV